MYIIYLQILEYADHLNIVTEVLRSLKSLSWKYSRGITRRIIYINIYYIYIKIYKRPNISSRQGKNITDSGMNMLFMFERKVHRPIYNTVCINDEWRTHYN